MKFKSQVAIVWVVLQGVLAALIYFAKLDPAMAETIKQLMVSVTVIAGVVLTGHTVTDVFGIVSQAKVDSSATVTDAQKKINSLAHVVDLIKQPGMLMPEKAAAAVNKITETLESGKTE